MQSSLKPAFSTSGSSRVRSAGCRLTGCGLQTISFEQIVERDDRLAFLDFDNLMLGWDEKPRRELYVEDGLHLSPLGYQVWTAVLRPYLIP